MYRAHRALRPKKHTGPPRDIICRLHNFTIKEQIMRAARSKREIQFEGSTIQLYPDLAWVSSAASSPEATCHSTERSEYFVSLGIPILPDDLPRWHIDYPALTCGPSCLLLLLRSGDPFSTGLGHRPAFHRTSSNMAPFTAEATPAPLTIILTFLTGPALSSNYLVHFGLFCIKCSYTVSF